MSFRAGLKHVLSVGVRCICAFPPGLVVWALTDNVEPGRLLVWFLRGSGFGPAAVACDLFWFALLYWGTFSAFVSPSEMR